MSNRDLIATLKNARDNYVNKCIAKYISLNDEEFYKKYSQDEYIRYCLESEINVSIAISYIKEK